MEQTFAGEFIEQALHRMEENTGKIKKCLDEIHEDDLWHKPNFHSNSIGNLILHLCGNITQYIISSLGEVEDFRERDKEFSASGGFSRHELFNRLSSVVAQAAEALNQINHKDLLRKRSVQGFEYSAIGIILHVVEHYSYHTGQIIFWTKLLKDKDLGFYANVDLNRKNRNKI